MLGDLSGALTNWIQAFNSAGGANPTYIPGEPVQRTWRQREYHGYFKDDWKVSRKVTLNLGIRYEYYTPGYEVNARPSFQSWVPPAPSASAEVLRRCLQSGAANGTLTELILVGGNSAIRTG
jgi:outer membrane receptor protein involved in Fe transport